MRTKPYLVSLFCQAGEQVRCHSLSFTHNTTTLMFLFRSSLERLYTIEMPNRTERQQATDALTRAYLLKLIAGIYADQDSDDSSDFSESSSDSLGSKSSSSDSETESEMELDASGTRNTYLYLLDQLHSHRYLNGRDTAVEKTDVNLRMLLDRYKTTHPGIFRSYF